MFKVELVPITSDIPLGLIFGLIMFKVVMNNLENTKFEEVLNILESKAAIQGTGF